MTWKDLSFDPDFTEPLEAIGYEIEFDQSTNLLTLRDESGRYRFKSSVKAKNALNLVKSGTTISVLLERVFGVDDGVEEET